MFLRKLKRGAVLIPSADDIERMAQTLVHRSDGATRVTSLLQALDESDGSVRESILAVAEEYLHQRQALTTTAPADYRLIAERLLRPVVLKGRGPKPELLGIFLLLAYHRTWLAEEEVIELFARVFPAPKTKSLRSGEGKLETSPVSIILAAPFKKPILPLLLALHSMWRKRSASFGDQITQLQATIASLELDKAELNAQLQNALRKIGDLETDGREKSNRIREMEQELDDVRTSFQHRIDEIKGRLRGFLEGELSRWVQNASEAADMEPPRLGVIQERLQSTISGINREAKWLQASD
jgi:hypothetical protein